MKHNERTVVVLGASDKPDRYSNRAVRLLKAEAYRVIPVHPTLDTVEGLAVRHGLACSICQDALVADCSGNLRPHNLCCENQQ